jgi:hypothetical protein
MTITETILKTHDLLGSWLEGRGNLCEIDNVLGLKIGTTQAVFFALDLSNDNSLPTPPADFNNCYRELMTAMLLHRLMNRPRGN